MKFVADILVALVALLHIWFLVLEMFLWTKPLGLKTFGNTPERAPVCENTARNVVRSRPGADPRARPSASAAVLLFITMLTSAFTAAA